MANHQESFLSGSNIDFIEGLYARYLKDPESVDASWRELFDGQRGHGSPVFTGVNGAHGTPSTNGTNGAAGAVNGHGAPAPIAAGPAPATQASPARSMALQARVDQTIISFRLRGHLLAKLDPLGRPR